MLRNLICLPCVIFALCLPIAALAQNNFAPVIRVNSDAITAFELRQRQNFLAAIGTAGDLERSAREALIHERLMLAAIREAGISIPEERITQEMEAFAGRGRLSLDEFRNLLEANDVDFLSFKDFAAVQLGWRELVGARFVSQINVSEDDIERALALSGGGLQVLLAEIILPTDAANQEQTLQFAEELKNSIATRDEFERAARRYSASPSRADSGRLDWLNLSTLSNSIAGAILAMSPGQISDPINVPGAIALFQLRSMAENRPTNAEVSALDYMLVQIPEPGSGAANSALSSISANVDTCGDLWAVTDDLGLDLVDRQTLAPAAVPSRIRAELGRLDDNELSTRLTSADGAYAWAVMLCGRSLALSDQEEREAVINRLRAQRIEQLAESYLADLRAAAVIEGL